MEATSHEAKPSPDNLTDDDRELLEGVRRRFHEAVGTGAPIFTTDASGLWDLFLAHIPPDLAQIYNCHACRDFVEKYGSLAIVTDDGLALSVLWHTGSMPFAFAIGSMMGRITVSPVTGVFLSTDLVWGKPVTGLWSHFAVTPPKSMIYRHPLLSPAQAMAEKLEDFRMLGRALEEFSTTTARTAVNLIESGDALYRSEKVKGVAEWFLGLHKTVMTTRHDVWRNNLLWRAVATAPPGWCHIRSTMIGTLLEDIASGMRFVDVKSRFDAKMHPLLYARPTAAPTTAEIAQAEATVAALDVAGSLARRFAKVEDVHALWKPQDSTPAATVTGVFSGVLPAIKTPRKRQAIEAPETPITWVKFQATVLPTADSIEYWVAPGGGQPYITLTTAVNPDAPPILQWDDPSQRNSVGWYVYHSGSQASTYSLTPRTWVPVTAVCLLPPNWYRTTVDPHHGEGAIFLLAGARDTMKGKGLALFPEILLSVFRPVRKTLEAFSQNGTLQGADEASASGIDLRKGSRFSQLFRVTRSAGRVLYRLDRWD